MLYDFHLGLFLWKQNKTKIKFFVLFCFHKTNCPWDGGSGQKLPIGCNFPTGQSCTQAGKLDLQESLWSRWSVAFPEQSSQLSELLKRKKPGRWEVEPLSVPTSLFPVGAAVLFRPWGRCSDRLSPKVSHRGCRASLTDCLVGNKRIISLHDLPSNRN